MLDLSALSKKNVTTAQDGVARETGTAGFEADVLAASMSQPVIVDFWAPWCGPCKQLAPALEKAVAATKGAVLLFKVDIDKNPELAQALRIQSVPTVYAFYQGQPIDGFTGAQTETALQAFIDKLQKTAAAQAPAALPEADIIALLQKADAFFEDKNYTDAMAAYSTVLDLAPDNMEAMGGIGWSLVAEGALEGVFDILASLTPAQKEQPRIKGLVFLQEQAQAAETLPPLQDLQARVDKTPKDQAARYDLARRLLGAGDIAAAIDTLVDSIRHDRAWQEQNSRALLLEIFAALGPAHALVVAGRRKLSAVLFS